MKRIIVLVAAAALLGTGLITPQALQAQVTLGIGGGLVSAKYVGDDADILDTQSETGISVGAWLAFPFGERLAFVPGAHFVQKGTSLVEPGVGSAAIEVGYLELPLLLSVTLTPADASVGVNVFAGPSIAFEVSCSISATDGTITAEQDCDPADSDDRQTTDIGGVLGAGVQFPLNDRLALSFSGGVDIGFRNLDTSADPADVKNRAFFGSVALVIPVGN